MIQPHNILNILVVLYLVGGANSSGGCHVVLAVQVICCPNIIATHVVLLARFAGRGFL